MPEAERRLREGDLMAENERRHARFSYLIVHGFEISFAVAGMVTAIQFIADPTVRATTAVGALGTISSWCWTVLYMLGSVGIVMGLIRLQDRVELAGLSCFAAAALVNAAVLLQVRGSQGVYVALIFLGFVGGSVARIYLLLALRRLISQSPSTGR